MTVFFILQRYDNFRHPAATGVRGGGMAIRSSAAPAAHVRTP
ncbi:hypothetical protein [Catenuloplanes atrovinosus]|uniref:Uncharacterized protein n=1 Tax=Catenuloplanes atrovinosus TaxID=137266 RepID=A0AAE4CA42_9ACTN|nr:hypothetical protein [Catenuloplanes atrovinosus]MDR7276673.1 hypothetical protein [Catenuloplanes atrovinosus]